MALYKWTTKLSWIWSTFSPLTSWEVWQVLKKVANGYDWEDESWWIDIYDAIVDASGQGDYTTIGAAVDANKRNIFVRNWTYTETQWHFVTFNTIDWLSIKWESKEWVIVNITLTTVTSQWWEHESFPAFLFVNADDSSSWVLNISWITFNISINTTVSETCLVRTTAQRTQYTHFYDIHINNCTFNPSNEWTTETAFTIVKEAENHQAPVWNYDICNCRIDGMSYTAKLSLREQRNVINEEQVIYKNTDIIIRANNNLWWAIGISYASDCNIIVVTSNFWQLSLNAHNLNNCYVRTSGTLSTSYTAHVQIYDTKNSIISITHQSNHGYALNTEIPDWVASTSYSVWNLVYYAGEFYVCTTAHTSSSDRYTDTGNWDDATEILLENISDCTISLRGDTTLNWLIANNVFQGINTYDYLISNCRMIWNSWRNAASQSVYMRTWIFNANDSYPANVQVYYVWANPNVVTNNIIYDTAYLHNVWWGNKAIVANNSFVN